MSDPAASVSFPMKRTCPFQAPAEYKQLRAETPVARAELPSGRPAWLLTRYADVRQALADPRVSPDRRHDGFPLAAPIPPEVLRSLNLSLLGMDPPEHTALRRLLIPEFTYRKMKGMRPHIERIVDACVDRMLELGGPVDLVAELSLPVPSQTVARLLGVPYEDHPFFQSRTRTMLNREAPIQDRTAANAELTGYLSELVEAKAADPGEDLIGRLIVRAREAGIDDPGAVLGVARLLLVAGHETTANMISLSVVALDQHPYLREEFVEDPSVAPSAVEELLRFFSVSDVVTGRAVLEDLEVGGVAIAKGEGLIALTAAANRDPEVFDHPDRLDFHRDAGAHVAFGHGIHQCLGQNLARVELETALTTLYRRLPGLRLAVPAEELRYADTAEIYGVLELPVTW